MGEMTPRLVKGMQGSYIEAEFDGVNMSDIEPVGKRVLVLMDEGGHMSPGGVYMAPEVVERMSLASETGVVVALGGSAFKHHQDGSSWTGARPGIGDRVYVEKYAGLLAKGVDGRNYRIMDDGCVGAKLRKGN